MSKHTESKPEPAPITPKQDGWYTVAWIAAAMLAMWALFALTAPPSNAAPAPVVSVADTYVNSPACSDPRKVYTKDGIVYSCGPMHMSKDGRTMVRCMGVAGLGALKGGGYYGAAVAGAGCLWATNLA